MYFLKCIYDTSLIFNSKYSITSTYFIESLQRKCIIIILVSWIAMYSLAIIGGLEVDKMWNQIILINSYSCYYLKCDMLFSIEFNKLSDMTYKF